MNELRYLIRCILMAVVLTAGIVWKIGVGVWRVLRWMAMGK